MSPASAALALSHRWPLSARVAGALALVLIPLSAIAALLAIAWCQDVLHNPAITAETARLVSRLKIVATVLPLGMAVTAIGVGWLVAHRFVVAPLQRLQELVEAADRGDALDANVVDDGGFACREIRALAGSVVQMARDGVVHDRDLDAALAEQTRLTREIHHRVKNSLQIVSSLLSLHARGDPLRDVGQAYAAVQAHVAALTMVHRWIHDDGGVDTVNLHALFVELAAALEASLMSPRHPHPVIAIADVASVSVHADAAFPLAFLVTELASIGMQQSGDGVLQLAIAAQRDGDRVTITVSADAFAASDWIAENASTASARIVQGMAGQVRGNLRHVRAPGGYTVDFVDR